MFRNLNPDGDSIPLDSQPRNLMLDLATRVKPRSRKAVRRDVARHALAANVACRPVWLQVLRSSKS